MPNNEIKFRYDPHARKWVGWTVCPRNINVACACCGRVIKFGQRIYVNFDNGKHYCELHESLAWTDFVQVIT